MAFFLMMVLAVAIIVLDLLLIGGSLLLQKPKSRLFCFWGMVVLSVLIAALNFSASPSNYLMWRVLYIGVGLVALVGAGLFVGKKEKLGKLLAIVALVASSLLYLFL